VKITRRLLAVSLLSGAVAHAQVPVDKTSSERSADDPDLETTIDDDDEEKKRKAPKERDYRVHDGFYLRAALGTGYISATTDNDSEISGWGIAPDIWIGGSPTPGLALAATLNGVTAPSPHATISAAESGGAGQVQGTIRGSLVYSAIGLVADIYPTPREGLHFMAGANYSTLHFDYDNGAQSGPATGVGLVGGVGYEAWIGREWSLGPLARLHWASVSQGRDTPSVLSPVFLLGLTYH
jgi:hypothetical protein